MTFVFNFFILKMLIIFSKQKTRWGDYDIFVISVAGNAISTKFSKQKTRWGDYDKFFKTKNIFKNLLFSKQKTRWGDYDLRFFVIFAPF